MTRKYQESAAEALEKAYNATFRALTVTGALTEGAVKIGLVSGTAKTISVTKVIEAKGDYAAEDVLSSDTDTGDALTWDFAAIFRANNTGGYITKAVVSSETTALTMRLSLYLYNAAPTCKMADNEAHNGVVYADIAKSVGRIDFPAMGDLGGTSEAIATPNTASNLPMWVDAATAADDLHGVLVTRDIEASENAGDDFVISLTVEQY